MFELPPLVLGRRFLGGRSEPNLVFQFSVFSYQFSVFSRQFKFSVISSQLSVRTSRIGRREPTTDQLTLDY